MSIHLRHGRYFICVFVCNYSATIYAIFVFTELVRRRPTAVAHGHHHATPRRQLCRLWQLPVYNNRLQPMHSPARDAYPTLQAGTKVYGKSRQEMPVE